MPQWPKLTHPEITFDAGGTPVSSRFGDIYYSPSDGLAESKSVFLDGIGAPDCWIGKPVFNIGETGFGTGLNFLVTWQQWRQTAAADARLNFVSVEGFPLSIDQLSRALRPFSSLKGQATSLIEQYPVSHSGYHRLSFDGGRVNLTLMLGDAETMLRRLTGCIDAWYLDGFAPSRNPDMWTQAVYAQLARLSKKSTRIATFTAAGHVRRGLQAAGFGMQKTPGFGHKKERLIGQLEQDPDDATRSWSNLPEPLSKKSEIAIIGSGIAGSAVAHALRTRGFNVTVFDREGIPGGGMAGNPAAILSPKPPADASLSGRINTLGFLDAIRRYDSMHERVGNIWQEPRGVLALSAKETDADRRAKAISALNWPATTAHMQNDSRLSGFQIASFPESGCVDPVAVCSHLNDEIVQARPDAIEPSIGGWILKQDEKIIWQGDSVVVAAGGYSTRLLKLAHIPLHPNRGQISMIDSAGLEDLPTGSLSFDGYLSPEIKMNGKRIRVLGSSFAAWRDLSDEDWRVPRREDHNTCVRALQEAVSSGPSHGLDPVATWCSLRAAPPDRVPLMGGVPDEVSFIETYSDMRTGTERDVRPPLKNGLYILAGLGARGYQLGPLLGETLADLISGEPAPLESDLLNALNPARFLVRGLKRQKF